MTDPRFTTAVSDVQELLNAIDVDQVGDVETLLMFVLGRPITVQEEWDEEMWDAEAGGLLIIVRGNSSSQGSIYGFPTTILDLVRECGETADELGPFVGNEELATEVRYTSEMTDPPLIALLREALSFVRLFNLMEEDDSSM